MALNYVLGVLLLSTLLIISSSAQEDDRLVNYFGGIDQDETAYLKHLLTKRRSKLAFWYRPRMRHHQPQDQEQQGGMEAH